MKTRLLISLFFLLGIQAKATVVILRIDSLTQPAQNITLYSCDTLLVINHSGFADYYTTDTVSWNIISPDTVIHNSLIDVVSYFYTLPDSLSNLYITHQFFVRFYNITLLPCTNKLSNIKYKDAPICYPNPVTDCLTVNTNLNLKHYQLYSANGELAEESTLNANTILLNLKPYAAGTYTLYITDKNNTISIKKIIKINP